MYRWYFGNRPASAQASRDDDDDDDDNIDMERDEKGDSGDVPARDTLDSTIETHCHDTSESEKPIQQLARDVIDEIVHRAVET